MPRISSMAVEDFEAIFFEAMNRARWARTLEVDEFEVDVIFLVDLRSTDHRP